MTTEDRDAGLQQAAALIDLGRFAEAGERARSILASDPQSANAAALLAQAALGLKDVPGAIDAAQSAISIAAEWWWPHILLSVACSRAGERSQAINSAAEALRLEPTNYLPNLRLAEALLEDGRPGHARPFVERALQLAPNFAGAHYVAGRLEYWEGRTDQATSAFRKALSIDPNHSPSMNELARLRVPLGLGGGLRAAALADAAGGFATAVQADPRSDIARGNLDRTILGFLRYTAYFVFVAVFFGSNVATSNPNSRLGEDLPLTLLAVPVIYAVRFMVRLRPQLRRFVLDLVLHRPATRIATALLLGAVSFTVAAVASGGQLRPIFLAVAGWLAIASRVLLWRHQRSLRTTPAPGRLRAALARLLGHGDVPSAHRPSSRLPQPIRRRRRTRKTAVAIVLLLGTLGVVESGVHTRNLDAAPAPGYPVPTGGAGYPLPIGRPWGTSCQPIDIVADPTVPAWIYVQARRTVLAARQQGVNVAIANPDGSWPVNSHQYRGQQSPATAVPLHVSYGTPPSGEHIELSWTSTTDPDGHNEDIAMAEGTIWMRAVGHSDWLVRRSVRQLIALTQGILRTSNTTSGINDAGHANGFTAKDLHAMQVMSGCARTTAAPSSS